MAPEKLHQRARIGAISAPNPRVSDRATREGLCAEIVRTVALLSCLKLLSLGTRPAYPEDMRTLVETLLEAQPILLQKAQNQITRRTVLKRLEETIPAPVLSHYLRMVEQGRKGAVVVRNGVCSGCHLRVASGIVAALVHPTDLHLCDNCGAYLMLAPEEMPQTHPVPELVAAPARKPRARRVVAV